MRSINLALVVVFLVIVSWAWQTSILPVKIRIGSPVPAEALDQTGSMGTGANVIKDLPCFKCHIYERFVQEPAKGVFSHALHVQFEYHCNQCHSFRGHRRMVINTEICTFCHQAVPEIKKN